MNLLSKLQLNEEYIFNGKMSILVNKFKQLKEPSAERLDVRVFKLRPFLSLGTLLVRGFNDVVGGINVKATLSEIDRNRQIVQFTTRIRLEHALLVLAFPLFISTLSFNRGTIHGLLPLFGLWAILHLWFQLIYRIQEKRVVNKVVKKFHLEKSTQPRIR